MLEKLLCPESWAEFLSNKLNNNYISNQEKEYFSSFILEEKYMPISKEILDGSYKFSIPTKHIISKHHSEKKRVVYYYNEDEMLILKYIAYLLYEYDSLFTQNLYSFRKSTGVHQAIHTLKRTKNLKNMYGYKLDISNYFNSIDTSLLLPDLKNHIDEDIYLLIEGLLLEKQVKFGEDYIEESKGIMAGTPISAFLANFFIRSIDEYFNNEPVMYLRYADDIILFANSEEEIKKYAEQMKLLLSQFKLNINKEKEYFYKPSEEFEFLGFSFEGKKIDISKNSIQKMKGKIHRSSHGIRRWMLKKNAKPTSALKGIIRRFNRRFLGNDTTDLSFKYWFFPEITKTDGLHIIDEYFQSELRYIVTGKHNKKNLEKVPYEMLKACGYKSLVHEYYLFLNMKNENKSNNHPNSDTP